MVFGLENSHIICWHLNFSAGPGMGKTSSMAKLALDWEPSRFNEIFLVKCTRLLLSYK